VLRVSSQYVTAISIFTGPLFFLLVSTTGDIFRLGQFPWQAHVWFALSGIIHFVLGRSCGFRSIQLVGSTRSNITTSLNVIVSIVLAVIVLQETVTPLMILGIILALLGPLLIAVREQTVASGPQAVGESYGKDLDRRTLYKGLLYGAGAAIFWGSSAIFVKLGLESGGSPIAGSLVAYLAASLVISPSILLSQERKQEILRADRQSWRLALLTGLFTNTAQMLRYLALAYTSVIAVSIMARTISLWVLLFAFIFNRSFESFSRWVLLGNVLLITGTVLVLIS
jgi:drug/metabolite transporter (DMT)-like permease